MATVNPVLKIGLFFGSFNPIHIGHLILAESLLACSNLDRVWFVVTPHNPDKERKSLINEYDRLRMVELAVADNYRLQASNVEFFLPKPSLTIHTLDHLSKQYPDYQFAILMGEDNLRTLHRWDQADRIIRNYPIYVYPRNRNTAEPAVPASDFLARATIHYIDSPSLDLSATYIRRQIINGKSIRYLVPEAVRHYIESKQLFQKL
jgi:nicotinate-nucleotide adenylyltransferase